ncbi:MAG TPA: DNA-binding protein [Candidatus Methylomirabilis sp.]|nr:DNA-binding protein [Candidatus Methylomirabilis sp.]
MKKLTVCVPMVSILSLLLATGSLAQHIGRDTYQRPSEGWGPGGRYGRMYNPKTVETINGEVVSVTKMTPMKGMTAALHLMLKTDKETVSVHLGPWWYLEKQKVKLEPKDTIEVKGSRVTFNEKPAIIAAEVKKGTEVMRLREETGFPVWLGSKPPLE